MNTMKIEQARFNMIEQQIRTWDVLNDQILETLAHTPREDFLPEACKALAFSDISVPLGHDQAMMAPKIEAKLLQSLTIEPSDRVLEIGTGSGYLTACLAKLGSNVHSIDIYQDFIDQASEKITRHELRNVTFEQGDASSGWQAKSGFDVIAVTGSLPILHEGFHKLLKPGGRMFVIAGTPPIMQALLITRVGNQEWSQESLFDTSVPPLVNAPQPDRFNF